MSAPPARRVIAIEHARLDAIDFQDLTLIEPPPRVACGWFTRDSRRHFFEVYETGGMIRLKPVRRKPRDPDYVLTRDVEAEIGAAYERWRQDSPRY